MTTLATASRDALSPLTRNPAPSFDPIPVSQRPTRLDRPPSERITVLDREPLPIRVPGITKEIEVKLASRRQEWEEAFQLVASNYRARGYEAVSSKRFRFTPYHALSDTATFVAKHQGHVVTTFSLVADNTLMGLPMESIYGDEIQQGRQCGRRMAEVTSLADSGLGVREFLQVFTTIIKLMFQYHAQQGGNTWVITVNPRHRSFYTKVLGFVPLGPCRSYACVQDAPAEAYLLDRDLMRANAPKMYDDIFGEPLPAAALIKPTMPLDVLHQFAADSTQTDPRQVQDILDFTTRYGSPRRW